MANEFKRMQKLAGLITESQLNEDKSKLYEGFKVIIYANHLLRASYAAMLKVAKKILSNKRSFEAEKNITPIKDIISLT